MHAHFLCAQFLCNPCYERAPGENLVRTAAPMNKSLRCNRPHSSPDTWPFSDPPTLAVITTREVLSRAASILLAAHEPDGSWTFLDRDDWTQDDLVMICFEHIFEIEPELHPLLLRLPTGRALARDAPGGAWSALSWPPMTT